MAVAEKIPGFHFSQSEDGAFAVEVDIPCDGVVTVTWKAGEYPSKSAVMELPQGLFLAAVKAYLAEHEPKNQK